MVPALEEAAGNTGAVPPLAFRMGQLFEVPGHLAPPNVAAMPDVIVPLERFLQGGVRAMVRDIVNGRWQLTAPELHRILAVIPDDPAHEFHALRVFAATALGL